MSRSASTITPDAFPSFGALLRYLRRRARLTQAELAIAVGYSEGQISRLEQNHRLPDLTTLVALFVPALELEEEPEWVARLLELAALARGEPLAGRSVQYSSTTRDETVAQVTGTARRPTEAPAYPPGLPVLPTPLVGRAAELATLEQLLSCAEVRLLTLSGPPGVGKSRLALALAARAAPRFADGVRFVPLAAVHEPALVPEVLAQVFGLAAADPAALISSITEHLRPLQLLLVLDNLEHLLSATPLIAAVLAAAPGVKVLLTSRIVARLLGEHEWAVPPLALPPLSPLPPLDALAANPAVALFVQRAGAVQPAFELTTANALAVAAICARLDGLPLAIELAAARVKLLAPAALLQRLARRLPTLTGGARDLAPHQRTLHGAIAWSYDQLSLDEQALFARLGVFVGGWTLSAAEAVCDFGFEILDFGSPLIQNPKSEIQNVLDGIAALLDHSLVQAAEPLAGERHFAVLETLREYALEQLAARGETDLLGARHAAYWLRWIEEAEAHLEQPAPEDWLAQFARNHDNLRAALAWAERHESPTVGVRLAGALWRFWYAQGWLHEGRDCLARMLARRPDEQEDAARARALNGAANLAWRQGEYDAAEAFCVEALALAQAADAPLQIARAWNTLGTIAGGRGEYDLAAARYREALAVWQAVQHPFGTATALLNLGNVATNQGDYGRAVELYEESLALSRAVQDTAGIPLTLNNLGVARMLRGEYAQAETLFRESLALHRALNDQIGANYALNNLGAIAIRTGQYAHARTWLRENIQLSLALGDQISVATACAGLAEMLCAQPLTPTGAEQAAQLCGAAASIHARLGAPLDAEDQALFDRSVAMAQAALGKAVFAAAWAQGQTMTLEQVVQYALAVE